MATDKKEKEVKTPLTGNFEIEVEGFKCIIEKPNRFTVQAAMSKMTKTSGEMDMIGAGEIVFNSHVKTCDDEIKNDDSLLIAVFAQCAQLLEIKEATLKKI